MNTELRLAAEDDGTDVYGMLQEMLPNDNGFENGAHGISVEEYKVWLKRRVSFSLGQELADWQVPENTYWLYVDGLPVGYGKLRHRLTEALKEAGGHIGYGIRPTQRGKGYGSLILKLLLVKAGELGIAEVLIDCFAGNEPSRKVIEANRGVLARRTDKRLYYHVAVE
jgi:predicted acetyltransferase